MSGTRLSYTYENVAALSRKLHGPYFTIGYNANNLRSCHGQDSHYFYIFHPMQTLKAVSHGHFYDPPLSTTCHRNREVCDEEVFKGLLEKGLGFPASRRYFLKVYNTYTTLYIVLNIVLWYIIYLV